jgi:hypothetical protein
VRPEPSTRSHLNRSQSANSVATGELCRDASYSPPEEERFHRRIEDAAADFVLAYWGLPRSNLVLDIFCTRAHGNWEKLAPVIAIVRRSIGDAPWENFEYLAVLSEDYVAAHPEGTYPAGLRRIGLKDEFLAADKQYAASLAPA